MPRNNTTSRTVPGRAVRKSTGRRKPATGTPGNRVAAPQQVQPPHQAGKKSRKQPEQQTRQQQASSTAWQDPAYIDHDPDGKAEWDDAVQCAQDVSKTRQRIEMLREERLLQQALIDTFDF